MKVKPLLEKLTDKWYVKAASIVVACLLYIFNQFYSLEQKSLPVSLNVSQEGEMLCTTHIPSSISVTIKTTADNLSQISSEGIVASLDLSYITREGNYDVPVFVDLPPNIKSLDPLQVIVYPEKIKVHLEKNISRPIKIVARGAGQLPYGYTVKNFLVAPSFVNIYGPRSIVESITSMEVEPVDVDGHTATFSEIKNLVNHDRLIRIEGSTEFSVTTEIELVQGTRFFTKYPIEYFNLDSKLEVANPAFADLTITGAQLGLDEYEPLPDIVSADLSAITTPGIYEVPVTVLIPNEFRLENISVENVMVEVREKKSENEAAGAQ